MKTIEAIIEDPAGNVIGAVTSEGRIMLPENARFPRSELISRARDLAAAFDLTIPEAVKPILQGPV